jgi:hypothetical protein
MEAHDHPHDARDTTGETHEHSHPAQSVQPDTGFEEGLEQTPDTAEEAQEPDFARGLRDGPSSEVEDRNRFSEGQEQTADPENEVEGSFATGQEEGTSAD